MAKKQKAGGRELGGEFDGLAMVGENWATQLRGRRMIVGMARKKATGTIWTRKRLKALRERLGLTQKAAAERLGVATRTWIAWENSHGKPGKPAAKLLTLLDNGQL